MHMHVMVAGSIVMHILVYLVYSKHVIVLQEMDSLMYRYILGSSVGFTTLLSNPTRYNSFRSFFLYKLELYNPQRFSNCSNFNRNLYTPCMQLLPWNLSFWGVCVHTCWCVGPKSNNYNTKCTDQHKVYILGLTISQFEQSKAL